jgi:hypothetical protein
MPIDDHPRTGTVAKALAADVICVLVFCAIGRRSHAEGMSLGGLVETAWPFLTGTGLGWVLAQGWRRPLSLAPTGLVIWICTVVVAMLLRKVTSQGTAISFIVVATVTTGALLLGWRGAARLAARRS